MRRRPSAGICGGLLLQHQRRPEEATGDRVQARGAIELAELAAVLAVGAQVRRAVFGDEEERSVYDHQAARAQVSAAKAQVQQTKASLDYAENNLRYTRIVSPVDGIVISRNFDVGQTVAASFQTPTLFNIAQDLTKMQIDTNVDEADIGKIRVDQPVEFTVVLPRRHIC